MLGSASYRASLQPSHSVHGFLASHQQVDGFLSKSLVECLVALSNTSTQHTNTESSSTAHTAAQRKQHMRQLTAHSACDSSQHTTAHSSTAQTAAQRKQQHTAHATAHSSQRIRQLTAHSTYGRSQHTAHKSAHSA